MIYAKTVQETISSDKKLTDWANEPTILQLKTDYASAKTAHDVQIAKIANWNDQLEIKGKAKPPAAKNRSQVQPKLIRRQAEWRYSALSEPFLSSDKLFEVTPRTFEDHDGAQQNELVLNWQMDTKLNKVKFIDDFVRSTVDEGTSVVRVGWKRVVKKIKKPAPVFTYYEAETEEQVQELELALAMSLEDPRTYNESVSPEVKAAVEYYKETQAVTYAVQTGEELIEEDLVVFNNPTVEVKNPVNVCFDPSCQGDIDKAMFAVESFETCKADLMLDPKYKNLQHVNWEGNTPVTNSEYETNTPNDFSLTDTLRKRVVAHEYWGLYDIYGNGELEQIVACWIGNVMIRMELNPYPDNKIPFVLVPYLPVKRALYGEPDAELLEDNQKILGALTRGMIDSMARSANGQQGFAKGFLDPVQQRKFDNGENYAFNPNMPPALGHVEHSYPELPQSVMAMLAMVNQDSEAMSGVKSFSGGLSGQAYGDVATAIRGVLDASAKREMSILRRLAKGMGEIGQKIMAMNSVFLSETETIRITNTEFVSVQREDLIGNFDLKIDIATAEVDEARAQDLSFMLQTIGPNTDKSILMTILAEIARLKRMPKLAHTLKSWKPEPNPLAEKLQELEIAKMEAEIAKIQAETARLGADANLKEAQADAANLDFVEQEGGTKHARDLEKQAGQARGNQDLEITKALVSREPSASSKNIEAAVGYNQLSANI